jgi:hypothetical protein
VLVGAEMTTRKLDDRPNIQREHVVDGEQYGWIGPAHAFQNASKRETMSLDQRPT